MDGRIHALIQNTMDTLTKLFGNAAKVKVIKLFVFNTGIAYDVAQVADHTKESPAKVRGEISLLEKMDLIKRRVFFKTVEKKVRGVKQKRKVKANGWVLNDNFEHLDHLQNFLVSLNDINYKEMTRKLSKAGTLKLVIISGIFTQNPESRVDLLVVGDNLKRGVLEQSIKTIEAEIGKEIRYTYFETSDFKYRLGLYDKLIRDILDFPHEKILNKLGAF